MMLGHPLVCPILIGRGAALTAIEAALAAARAGQSYTLILSGEAGIGKSRLIAAAQVLT